MDWVPTIAQSLFFERISNVPSTYLSCAHDSFEDVFNRSKPYVILLWMYNTLPKFLGPILFA